MNKLFTLRGFAPHGYAWRGHALFLSLIISAVVSCKQAPDIVSPNPADTSPEKTGVVTAIGEPVGIQATKTIGPEGGTLTSTDGTIQLSIPAGALSAATAITIQPIKNYTPNGVGQAYRFSPDGLTFKQPATLTYQYPATATPEALRIAYQRPDKVWYSVPGQQIDKAARQVSVSMPHFSDWSLFEAFALVTNRPSDELIYFGESVKLYVMEIPELDAGKETALRIEQYGAERVGKWSLAGDGRLVTNADGIATYTAPVGALKQNPVTVSVELTFAKSPVKVILVRELVIGSGYVKLKFQGKDYFFTTVDLDDEDDRIYIGGGRATVAFGLEVSARSTGSFPFGLPQKQSGVSELEFTPANFLPFRTENGYCNGRDIIAAGRVVIEQYKQGKYAKGTFSGNLIDSGEMGCNNQGPAISGTFHVGPATR